MTPGCSSLLRPSPAPQVRLAVLAIVALALGTTSARAASPAPAPDPSPRAGLAEPDPYPAPSAPSSRTGPVHVTTVPVTIERLPVRKSPVESAAAAKKRVAPLTKRKAVAHAAQRPVETIRSPDHPAPQIVALGQIAVDPPRRVSQTLALTLGLLVLASTALVAGAARELAR